MSDKSPDGPPEQPRADGQPDPKNPLPKLIDQLKPPKMDPGQTRQWLSASQFAYTLALGTFALGFAGHWIGAELLGGRPWDVLLMLLFGALAFCAEIYRMMVMFSPKKEDTQKPDASKKDGAEKNKDEK
ncbi:MAG: AtpZ/AtpI family protein [Candidatus Melainabacteria bacterium]|nr:AtpZ/AtpI family protein [Candidatus Melainabacteria bacterium]